MRLIILFTLFVSAFSLIAQSPDESLTKARKKREKANYLEAAKIFKAYLEKNPGSREATTEFAEMLFFELKDYPQAYPYIKKVISYGEDTILFTYALAKTELYFGNYDKSLSIFKSVESLIPANKDNEWVIDDIQKCIKSIEYHEANKNKIVSKYLHLANLGNHVNSPYAEYVPVVDTKEHFVMFTSRRKNEFNPSKDFEDDMYHEDMYMSKRRGHDFDTAIALPYEYQEIKDVQNSKGHESLVSLSPDGNTLFIFKEGTLWKSELHGGKWTNPVKLEKEIVAKDYANHVTVTADGKNLFFTAEKKDSHGNLDIYKSTKNKDGSWTVAENLGETVNTKGNEQSPYISHDGKTLYFSTDSRPGFGGYDIFKTVFDGKKWSTPENIGQPFNSVADDIFFAPKEDFSEGFLASNRNGTLGDFDIYRFYFNNVPDFSKKDLIVIDNKDTSSQFAEINIVELIEAIGSDLNTENIFYQINDSLVIQDAKLVEDMIFAGSIKKLNIEQIKECDTCVYKSTNYYTIKNPRIISNDTIPIVSNNTNAINTSDGEKTFLIYFDFNEASVTVEAEKEMKAALDFIAANPNHKIQLIGHADTRGTEAYNRKLSEKRAKSAAIYFKNNKIKKSRFVSVDGRGEKEPAVACPNEPCDESINAKNRRVEIKLIIK